MYHPRRGQRQALEPPCCVATASSPRGACRHCSQSADTTHASALPHIPLPTTTRRAVSLLQWRLHVPGRAVSAGGGRGGQGQGLGQRALGHLHARVRPSRGQEGHQEAEQHRIPQPGARGGGTAGVRVCRACAPRRRRGAARWRAGTQAPQGCSCTLPPRACLRDKQRTRRGRVGPALAWPHQVQRKFPSKDAKLLVACSNGRQYSIDALEALDGAGYTNIVGLRGGYTAWFRCVGPLVGRGRSAERAAVARVSAGIAHNTRGHAHTPSALRGLCSGLATTAGLAAAPVRRAARLTTSWRAAATASTRRTTATTATAAASTPRALALRRWTRTSPGCRHSTERARVAAPAPAAPAAAPQPCGTQARGSVMAWSVLKHTDRCCSQCITGSMHRGLQHSRGHAHVQSRRAARARVCLCDLLTAIGCADVLECA
jgi:rhodanese-related sulfurtransferase